jgi:predicted Abi (CAAX) family protease
VRLPALRRFAALLLAMALGFGSVAFAAIPTPTQPSPLSSDALAERAPFNRPDDYPLDRRPDPLLYRPHAEWLGRLILPTNAEQANASGVRPGEDWVWIELEQAPADQKALVGRRLRLGWRADPSLEALVRTVTTDVRLDAAARLAITDGNVVPTRLDGRRRVGPLQSLAGARPRDDVTVELREVELREVELGDPAGRGGPDDIPILRVGRPPVQITGRWQALVRILGPASPGTDRFKVRHYDPSRQAFSGPLETVRIPQQPPNRYGRWMSTPQGIETSAIGVAGWYLYGAPDASGTFTVQALEPRALHQLTADRRIVGRSAGLRHLLHGNWGPPPLKRGTFSRVELEPEAPVPWRLGDRGLVIHNFGGIGGQQAEPAPAFTVTGHFAFGEVEVVRDPFSGEPRFAVRYHQIYANNPDGIVAGTQDWSAFAGDLRRGWLASRPFSDVLVQLDRFEDPQRRNPHLSLLRELQLQAEVLMARYRTGDGTGFNPVNASVSCVQDSSQALTIALGRLRRQLGTPAGAQGERVRRLESLTASLHQVLNPFGLERSDWRRNAQQLERPGEAAAEPAFERGDGVTDVLLSWRSMLPRRAHDDLAQVFFSQGAQLHLLRTNQTPGGDGRIEPLAPTTLLGQLPLVPTLLRRLSDALFAPLGGASLALILALVFVYATLALVLGRRSGFLPLGLRWRRPVPLLRAAGFLLLMPSLTEEVLFRVMLLPHPLEGSNPSSTAAWGLLSVGLFVAYHPLAGRTWYRPGREVFEDPRFLVQCTVLGVACVAAYVFTGSLWAPVLIHWLAVTTWLEPLQGRSRLRAPR